MKKGIRFLVVGALIAAVYAGLTYLMAFFGLAYGPIQLRVSEVLTILPLFTPAAIPGLAVGCFIANIASFNPIDMIFGTIATLLAAIFTYLFRNIKWFKLPLLSLVCPVVFNGIIVGLEIAFFFTEGKATLLNFAVSAAWVALGEAVICILLGIPFYFAIRKNKMLRGLLK